MAAAGKVCKKDFHKLVADFLKSVSGEKLEGRYLSGMMKIMQVLMNDPSKIILMEAELQEENKSEEALASDGKQQPQDDFDWSVVDKASAVPKWHLWAWIESKLKGTPQSLTSKAMELLDRRAGQATARNIVEYMTGIGPRTKFPEHMRDKSIIFEVLDTRYATLRRDIVTFFQKNVNLNEGKVDWEGACPYDIAASAEDGPANIIVHFDTALHMAIPSHLSLDQSWKKMNPWSDANMKWEKDKTPFAPAALMGFPEHSRFKTILSNNNQDVANIAKTIVDKKEAARRVASGEGLSISGCVAEAAKQRKKRRLSGAPAAEHSAAPSQTPPQAPPPGGGNAPAAVGGAAPSAAAAPPAAPAAAAAFGGGAGAEEENVD